MNKGLSDKFSPKNKTNNEEKILLINNYFNNSIDN